MATIAKRPTKKEFFNTIAAVMAEAQSAGIVIDSDEITYESIASFVDNELKLLAAKAEAAAKRAAERKDEGDALRENVYNVLSTENFMTIGEITAAIGDPDVSDWMVTARLKQLGDAVEKQMVTVPSTVEGGKSKKRSAYRRVG